MNPRQCALARKMMESPFYMPRDYYASIMDCSNKTVAKDIKAVDLFLRGKGMNARIETKRGSGIRLAIRESEKGFLEDAITLENGGTITAYERFSRGIGALLDSVDGCKYSELAALLLTNERQLAADIHAWNELLGVFGVRVVRSRGCARICGREMDIRMAASHYLYTMSPYFQRASIEPLASSAMRNVVASCINGLERAFGIALSENAKGAHAFYFSVARQRIEQGRLLNENDLLNAEECAIPQRDDDLKGIIVQALGPNCNETEVLFVLSAVRLGAMRDSSSIDFSNLLGGDVEERIEEFRRVFQRCIGHPVCDDAFDDFRAFYRQARMRKRAGYSVAIVNAVPMRRHHLDCLLCVEKCMEVAGLPCAQIFPDDLTRLAMCFFPSFDHAMRCNCRIGLVSNAGFEEARYGKYCIEQGGSLPVSVSVLTSSDVDARRETLADEFDILVGFEAMESAIPFCRISRSVDERDLEAISEFVHNVLHHEKTSESFAVDMGELNCESFSDAISMMYWSMRNVGVRMPFEQFRRQFFAHSVVSTGICTSALRIDSSNMSSAAYRFRTPHLKLIQPIPSIAILVVAERDACNIVDVAHRFSRLVEVLAPSNSEGYSILGIGQTK